jgi:predicted ATP-grasp superfamily ATP-dependent carboligase
MGGMSSKAVKTTTDKKKSSKQIKDKSLKKSDKKPLHKKKKMKGGKKCPDCKDHPDLTCALTEKKLSCYCMKCGYLKVNNLH